MFMGKSRKKKVFSIAIINRCWACRHAFYPQSFGVTQVNNTVWDLIQGCILPRSLFSAEDAMYCAKYDRRLTNRRAHPRLLLTFTRTLFRARKFDES